MTAPAPRPILQLRGVRKRYLKAARGLEGLRANLLDELLSPPVWGRARKLNNYTTAGAKPNEVRLANLLHLLVAYCCDQHDQAMPWETTLK